MVCFYLPIGDYFDNHEFLLTLKQKCLTEGKKLFWIMKVCDGNNWSEYDFCAWLFANFLVFEIFQELAFLYHVYWVNFYGHVTSLDPAHYLVISNPQWYKTTVERGNYWCINVKKKIILLCYVINYIIMENINFKILFWFQFTYTNEEQTTLKWWYKKFYKLRIGKIKKVSLNSCKHLTVNYIATRMILLANL